MWEKGYDPEKEDPRMKFFHLSDLHIGLKLINRDLREDQEYILRQIIELAVRERPDAVVVAGDLYDKAVPSAEAVEVFDHFIAGLSENLPETSVMLISGNHDSGPRVNCFRSVLSRQNVHMIGMPPRREDEFIEKVTLRDEYGNVNFYLLPFVKPSMVRQIVGTDENGNPLYTQNYEDGSDLCNALKPMRLVVGMEYSGAGADIDYTLDRGDAAVTADAKTQWTKYISTASVSDYNAQFTDEQNELYTSLDQTVNDYMAQNVPVMIKEGLDSWDAYVEGLNGLGIDEMTAVYQEIVDELFQK